MSKRPLTSVKLSWSADPDAERTTLTSTSGSPLKKDTVPQRRTKSTCSGVVGLEVVDVVGSLVEAVGVRLVVET